MSILRKDAALIDNTPPSIAYDPKTQSICAAWDAQAKEVIDAIDECVIIPNISKLTDSRLIDLLAWQFHVDFYEADAPLELRRELVSKSLQWHVYKGTKWCVEDVLKTVFAEGRVLEWFEYNPKPHADWHDAFRFKISTSTSSTDPKTLRRMIAAINAVKPASRWLEEFLIAKATILSLWTGSVTVKRIRTKVFWMTLPGASESDVFAGVSLLIRRIVAIPAPPFP